jgi:hypothetical protein
MLLFCSVEIAFLVNKFYGIQIRYDSDQKTDWLHFSNKIDNKTVKLKSDKVTF